MTIRHLIGRLLSRGQLTNDPNEPVELVVVPLASGPMTVASLRNDGFDATGDATYNLISEVASNYRIMVPRHQVAAASARLSDLL